MNRQDNLRSFLLEMEAIDIHKRIDDIDLRNNYLTIVFKESTNKYLVEELRLTFFEYCTLFNMNNQFQLVFNYNG